MLLPEYEKTLNERNQFVAAKAAEDLRKLSLPQTPADFKVALPENFTPPAGAQPFVLDEAGNKASFDALRTWAHSKGMDQSTFSEMLSLYASHQTAQDAAIAERTKAELIKAGPNAPQRVDHVGKFLDAYVGEADAKPLKATLVTDAHLRFFEKVIAQVTSQGTASFSQSHRVAPDQNKIPGYENMSFEQRRHAQEQRARRTA